MQAPLSSCLVRLHGDSIRGGRGLHMVQDYVPGKIPVVFVHGLMSAPLTWVPVFHEMFADPEISAEYQPWVYFYPTGDPIAHSAAGLREALLQARRLLDPEGTDAALDRMVIVDHSVGGVVSRMMFQGRDGTAWERVLGVDIDDPEVSAEERSLLRSAFVFEPVPCVARVIFIAAPHRGAAMARSPIGRLGRSIVSLPGDVVAVCRSALAREGREKKLPTGIDNLVPDDDMVKVIHALLFAEGVPYHSIVANVRGPEPGGTDGLVAYESAHLDGAQSEVIVQGHHDATGHPLVWRELRRILLMHFEDAKTETVEE